MTRLKVGFLARVGFTWGRWATASRLALSRGDAGAPVLRAECLSLSRWDQVGDSFESDRDALRVRRPWMFWDCECG